MPTPEGFIRNTLNLMGVNIDILDTTGLYHRIIAFVRDQKPHKVMYVNAHCMVLAQKDETYRKILNDADLVYADGMSLVWGARLSGFDLPGRSTAADFFPRFCELFAEQSLSIYLLGGQPGVAEAASDRLREKNPRLEIVGTHHGYFHSQEQAQIIESINRASPHIVLIGMGVPYQERWIEEHCRKIRAPVIWGVGALFDFLSGGVPRGPQWLLDSGFEWLCRLFAEPRRLWQRYLLGNLLFMWYVLHWRFSSKEGNRVAHGSH